MWSLMKPEIEEVMSIDEAFTAAIEEEAAKTGSHCRLLFGGILPLVDSL